MSKFVKMTAIAAVLAGMSGAAYADPTETKGGLKVKTEDGRFEFSVGGRVHLDAHVFNEDDVQPGIAAFGSNSGNQEAGGINLRRAYLTLGGKAYGWKYKFEYDLAASNSAGANTPASFRELWISTNVGSGDLTIGQFKPYRGMEELTSSNEITMIERPIASATGIYNNRQFMTGLGYKGLLAGDTVGYGLHLMSLQNVGGTTEGIGYGGRVFFAPMQADGGTLHIGLSASVDDQESSSLSANPAYRYGGRRGPSQSFGTAGAVASGAANPQFSNDNSQTTAGLELGASMGPLTLQGEYAAARLDNTHTSGGSQQDSLVEVYYVQTSFFVTGEKSVYKKDRGAFGKPKPIGENGAVELVARYEHGANRDQKAVSDAACGFAGESCEISTITVGANWYLNPNLRFMLNYYIGEADRGVVNHNSATASDRLDREDDVSAVTLRTQFNF